MADTVFALADAGELRSQWQALADRVDADPFLRPEWYAGWAACFGGGELRLATLQAGDRLVAALPVLREGARLASPVNPHSPHFGPLAEAPELAEDLLARLFRCPVPTIDLCSVDGGAAGAGLVRNAAARSRRRLLEIPLRVSPYVQLDGDWERFERSLSRNRRKGLRRLERRLAERGEVTLDLHASTEGLDAALAEAFAVEAAGWKGDAGTAIASQPHTRAFYAGVARWGAERGLLRLSFLRLDGRAVSTDLSLAHAGRWYSLKAGYDPCYQPLGPGAVHLHRLIRHAAGEGLRSVELLGDSDEFKAGWCTGGRDRRRVLAFARSLPGLGHYAYRSVRRRAGALAGR